MILKLIKSNFTFTSPLTQPNVGRYELIAMLFFCDYLFYLERSFLFTLIFMSCMKAIYLIQRGEML